MDFEGALSTGMTRLDALTGGLRRGAVTVLASEPAQGADSLALSIADNVISDHARNRNGVIYLHAQKDTRQMRARWISQRSGVALSVLGRYLELRETGKDDGRRIDEAVRESESLPLRMVDECRLDAGTLLQHARQAADEFSGAAGLGMIVIDSLDHMLPEDSAKTSRRDAARDAVRMLEEVARETGAAVVAVTHGVRHIDAGAPDGGALILRPEVAGAREQARQTLVVRRAGRTGDCDRSDLAEVDLMCGGEDARRTAYLRVNRRTLRFYDESGV